MTTFKIVGQEEFGPGKKHASKNGRTWFLRTSLERGNVDASYGKMEDLLGRSLSPMSRDLLDVAAYLYTADKLVARPPEWARDLDFTLPVRELKR